MRIFSEYENMDRSSLIEAEILKLKEYNKARDYINLAKLRIISVKGTREISSEDFKRIEKTNKVTKL